MKSPLGIKILGTGRYLPPRVVDNAQLEDQLGLARGTIGQTQSGVQERRWVNGETNSSMGAHAALDALAHAGMDLRDIDLIINASGTPEQAIPDGGALLHRQLGLGDSSVPAMTVHATCLSFLVGLNVAASFIATGQHRNILIVSSDIASVGLNPEEIEAFVLFGDAAAAAVVTATPPGEASCMSGYIFRTFSSGAFQTAIMGMGTRLHPRLNNSRPQDHLFHMDGKDVFKLALLHSPRVLEELRPGLTRGLGTIQCVVPHQASGLALRALAGFGWPADRVMVTLPRYGNCVAASIPLALDEAIKTGRIQRGDEVLLVGTGAGLSVGGALITY